MAVAPMAPEVVTQEFKAEAMAARQSSMSVGKFFFIGSGVKNN